MLSPLVSLPALLPTLLAAALGVAAPGPIAPIPASHARVDFHLAGGVTSVRENLITPLAATGPTLELVGRFAWTRARLRLEADARLGLAALFDRTSDESPSPAAHHELGAALLAALRPDTTSGAGLALGGAVRLATDVTYLEPWDDAHAYWLATLGLGPALRYARPLAGCRWLVARGDLTLAALASRPPARRLNKQDAQTHVGYYFDRIGEDPSFVGPWSLQQGRAEIALRSASPEGRADRGRWTLGAEVRFSRASHPQPYDNLYYGLFFGWGSGG